jgi:uncharacterized repeat protein (TIGR03837 family)
MPDPIPLAPPPGPLAWDIFCRVIDNHGDLGVCWRLAVDLARRGQRLRLWVDDASTLAWMAPQGEPGVQVMPWRDPQAHEPPGDVVIEAFGCEPPAAFVQRMAQRQPAPVWLNLEYLSAEPYVERSHRLPSPQFSGPGRGLTKWFFYPGYTAATGGLLREPGLLAQRDAHDRGAFLRDRLGLTLRRSADPASGLAGDEALVLLFGYPQPALAAWLAAFRDRPTTLLVTPGHSARAVAEALGLPEAPPPDSRLDHGALRLVFLPPVSQSDFDRLLWSCDWNLVRGEDSAVRALWAGQPFLWQLYIQDDGAQWPKLEAFLDRYLAGAPADLAAALCEAFRGWNGLGAELPWGRVWAQWQDRWRAWAQAQAQTLAGQIDLSTQLLDFVAQQRGDRCE